MVLAPLTALALRRRGVTKAGVCCAKAEVMNLIVGVLVEVVGVVAAAEQEAATRNAIFEALQEARDPRSVLTWPPCPSWPAVQCVCLLSASADLCSGTQQQNCGALAGSRILGLYGGCHFEGLWVCLLSKGVARTSSPGTLLQLVCYRQGVDADRNSKQHTEDVLTAKTKFRQFPKQAITVFGRCKPWVQLQVEGPVLKRYERPRITTVSL